MIIYRLTRLKYSSELSGVGAALFGNRWNSKGVEMIYTAESRALAMAEVMVHITLANLPSDFMMVEIDVPDELQIDNVTLKELNNNWNSNPFTFSTQKIGDEFIHAGKSCLLKVPSAVVQGDFNYLINPRHKDFNTISISKAENFPFDQRVFRS